MVVDAVFISTGFTAIVQKIRSSVYRHPNPGLPVVVRSVIAQLYFLRNGGYMVFHGSVGHGYFLGEEAR
jgi:hypothetical protein